MNCFEFENKTIYAEEAQLDIITTLTSKDDKNACAIADKIVSESLETDKWYEYFDDFASLLNHPKSLVRNRVLYILAANVKWDDEGRFDTILSEYLSHITDEKPITSRQCIKALAQIGQTKKEYVPMILLALRSADLSGYKDSMRPLIEKDIDEIERILSAVNLDSLFIRTATVDDAPELLDIYAYYVQNTAITFEYNVPALTEFKNRILSTLEKYPYIVATENDEILGYAYTGSFSGRCAYDWSAEVSVYIRKDKRRSGLGRMLYEAIEDISKAQNILNINACIAYPETEDEYLTKDSAHFHRHMGYSPVGEFHKCGFKFGRWYNMMWMEKMLSEHPTNPAPVTPFSEMRFDAMCKF